ncbi:MAG: outer membrane beta-barrel protein, partial [Candidatus Sulfotelmatobacter sp.]
ADHPAQNTQDGTLSADGTLDVTAGSYLYGSAQVAHQHIFYGSPNSPGNIAQPVTYWDYAATAGYGQTGRRFSYNVDVGVTAAQYNAALLDGGGVSPQSSQDGSASSVAVTGRYEIIPDYLGYIRVGGSQFDYWHTAPGETRPNFSTYRVDLGLQILPRHLISGEADVGYLVQKFYQSSLGSTSTPDYGGRLTWSITPRTTLNFTGLLTFNTGNPGAGLPSAGNSYLSSVFTASASYELLHNLQVGLTGAYINNSFQGITRTDNVIVLGAGFKYQVDRNLFLGGEFSYAEQNSTGGLPFTQNVLTVRAGTQF